MGRRGEAWVMVQAILLALIILAPKLDGPWPDPVWFRYAGWSLTVLGMGMLVWGAANLGRSLTPFPRPVAGGHLVTDGAYRLIRHPIYFAVLLIAFGFSLATTNGLRVALSVVLFLFFDRKSRVEEKWLEQQYPAYPAYRQRVKRLIPWIY